MTLPSPNLCRRLLCAVALLPLLAGPARAQNEHLGPDDAPPSNAKIATRKDSAPVLGFVHAYEPLKFGMTKDKDDGWFLDFTLSLMFPLMGDYASAEPITEHDNPWWGNRHDFFNSEHTALFLSGTVRAGQYIQVENVIEGRPSAPVVEKRFNPQLILRFWAPDGAGRESPNRFVDFIYGHESNGQSISSLARFNEQVEIYRQLEPDPNSQVALDRAVRSARDTISRGWDYVGVNASWSWRDERHVGVIKLREYLPGGFLQQGAEQSNDWEGFGPAKPRRQYDGVTLQYTIFHDTFGDFRWGKWRRSTLTYMTGLSSPGRYNTVEADLGINLGKWPLSFWYRAGYNSNLTNYYRRADSFGYGFTIWSFF